VGAEEVIINAEVVDKGVAPSIVYTDAKPDGKKAH